MTGAVGSGPRNTVTKMTKGPSQARKIDSTVTGPKSIVGPQKIRGTVTG